MKRKWFVYLVIFAVILVLPLFRNTNADKTNPDDSATFKLPSSLVRIEDEAFKGTAIETVVFPDGLINIGPGAFEDVAALKNVYIPDTTAYIADSAFSNTSDLTIHGIEGSYAKKWAYAHEVPFIVDNVWNKTDQIRKVHNLESNPAYYRYIASLVLIVSFTFYVSYDIRSRRPQDRQELNPIDYCFP